MSMSLSMSLSKKQPLSELKGMHKKMDGLFEELLSVGRNGLSDSPNQEGRWTPAVEIVEIDNELILKAKIPGVNVSSLQVKVVEDRVTISGEYGKEKVNKDVSHNYFYSEFNYGKFERVIPLPLTIKADDINYELKKGILTINLPKQENKS